MAFFLAKNVGSMRNGVYMKTHAMLL